MKYNEQNAKTVLDNNGALGLSLNTLNGNEYVRLSLEPNSGIPEHIIEFPVTFYVINGSGIMTVNSKEIEITTGDLLEVEAAKSRGLKNTNSEPLNLLVIKHIDMK